jgi:formate-dependent nitrite reductase membrane component NrfD
MNDGRDIDPEIGALLGEGSSQQSYGAPDKHMQAIAPAWRTPPAEDPGDATYYERPLLQEPVWEWVIPAYYFVGGLTGASLVLSAAAQLGDSSGRARLIRRCHWIGFAGCGMSGLLLIWDLGMPGRFLNMLRVFRPTSPMNMGAWILSGASGSGFFALLLRGRRGFFGAIGEACGYFAGIFGACLATYTGVLVSNTAIPVWQESRRVMPILFGASAIATAGSVFNLLGQNSEEHRLTNTFGRIGQMVELVAAIEMERQASEVPRVGRPFKEGISGFLWRTAAVLSAGSLVLSLLPGKSKKKRIAAGILGAAGSGLMRMSIEKLGTASARDPRASFHLQRAEKGAVQKKEQL